jgi:chromosome segregation ATPase
LNFDGRSIHRIKGKTKNEYYLDATKLVAFKQSPPEEIIEALNLDQKLSIQSQIDPFFLLQDSPGERARYLNQIAGLDKISTCISKSRSSIDQTKQAISSGEKHKQDLEEQLQGYQWLPEAEGHLAEVEALEGQIEDLSSHRMEIKRIVHAVKTKRAKLEELKKRTKAKEPVEECVELYEQIESCKEAKKQVQTRIDEIKDNQADIKRKQKQLQKDKQKFHDNMPDVCPLCGRTG